MRVICTVLENNTLLGVMMVVGATVWRGEETGDAFCFAAPDGRDRMDGGPGGTDGGGRDG